MARAFFIFMGFLGVFITFQCFAMGHYPLAIITLMCTAIEFWGAIRKEVVHEYRRSA